MSRFKLLCCILSVLAVTPATAAYRCVTADGRLTFQDRPCAPGQSQSQMGSEDRAANGDSLSPKLWTLRSGDRTVAIGLPRYWQSETRSQGAASTLRASADGDATQQLLLTVMPRKNRTASRSQVLADLLRAIRVENNTAADRAQFEELPFSVVMMKEAASGAYLVTGDAPATNSAGNRHYHYAIVGAVITDSTMIHFRLLTDDPQTDDAKMVLASLQMLVEQ